MASAIVRSRIANSTVDDILKNRHMLRDAIRNEMFEVVKGWGVWLETVEITDVKILSSCLFKDMQCKFREDQNKAATCLKLDVDTEIQMEKARHDKQEVFNNLDLKLRQKEKKQVQDLKQL